MRRILVLLTTMVMGVVLASGVALAAAVSEVEPNDSIAGAQAIAATSFDLTENADIADSTTIPHAEVDGKGNDTFDYYSFTVPQQGTTSSTFDIDSTEGGSMFGYDSYLRLFDSSSTVLAFSDDSAVDPGSTEDPSSGAGMTRDSYLTYTFSTPGTYYIEVGGCCPTSAGGVPFPVPNTATYRLNVSIPPDTTPPKVNSTSPANGATLIAPGANVTAIFSEAMDASPTETDGDPSTITGTTFKLMQAGTTTPIEALVSYNATTNKAKLDPNAKLQLGTKYKAVVTTGAQDVAGNRLDQDQDPSNGLQKMSWTFTIRN
jgi:hypothetical protein